EGEKMFPREVAISEQKFNRHLKVLAERIGFTDVLSNKVGRKTFATWADRLGMEETRPVRLPAHTRGRGRRKPAEGFQGIPPDGRLRDIHKTGQTGRGNPPGLLGPCEALVF